MRGANQLIQKGASASRTRVSAHERRKMPAVASQLVQWFHQSARDLPWRRTGDPYAIWVSEIMLQQTQVITVIPYYNRWMNALPDIESLVRASSARLHKLWEGLGYYTRVRNMQKAARLIQQEHAGKFPSQFEAVLRLPGIGRYTAGAICSIAFNQPTPILDGNGIRVLTRIFGITGNPREKHTNARLWQLAEELVACYSQLKPLLSRDRLRLPRKPCSLFNQALMELGATVCSPRNPQCPECPVHRNCVARRKKLTDQIPGNAPRSKTVERNIVILVIQNGNRFWTTQRPEGTLNAGLWEFPNSEEVASGSKRFKKTRPDDELLGTFKQSITRYRITARVFLRRGKVDGLKPGETGRWLSITALQRTPFSAMHRRIADLLLARKQTLS